MTEQPPPEPPARSQYPEPPASLAASAEPFSTTPARELPSRLLNAYWISGLAVLLAAVALFVYLHLHRRTPSSSEGTSATPVSQRAAVQPSGDSAVEDDLGTPPGPTMQRDPDAAARSPADAPIFNAPSAPGSHDGTDKSSNEVASSAALGHSVLRRPAPAKRHIAPTTPVATPTSDAREAVFLSSSGVMASHLIYAPAPSYPVLAKLTRLEGQVILQVVVSRQGTVAVTRVLSGPYLLRGAVEHTIHRWRYRPYLMDGHPTDVATIVTVSFRLRH